MTTATNEMRTNVVLDGDLVDEAFRLTGLRTKRELIDLALRELVRLRKKKSLADLAGKIRFHDGYDHKELRRARRRGR